MKAKWGQIDVGPGQMDLLPMCSFSPIISGSKAQMRQYM